MIDPELKTYATELQGRYIDAVNEHGSSRKAAKALGLSKSTINNAIERAKLSAAMRGYAPKHDLTHPVPDPYVVRGVSTYYDADGKASGQWIKTSLDDKRAEEIRRAAWDAMAAELPRLEPTLSPAVGHKELCNVYTLTDCHVGMLAWHKEGGADWDLKIAEATLSGCFEHMVLNSPKAAVGVVAQLGDFLHSDSLLPVTPTSGHVLDQDGRFSKTVEVAVRVLRRVVGYALTRHDKVMVLMAEGNHDPASSVWLRVMFKALFENEPRVEVIDSELPYYCYQHGQTMLAWHHGHLKKTEALPLLFAAQFPKVWGGTTHRYCHTGHRHHVDEREHSGMLVTQHATLSARDAYASRGGWLSQRQATSITYHSRFGQVARNTVTPEMLEC